MRWPIIKLSQLLLLVLAVLSGLSFPILKHHGKYRRHIDPRTIYTAGRTKGQFYYVLGCEIFGLDFRPVYRFPGNLCEFFKDGSVMIAYKDSLQYFNSRMQLLWQKDMMTHHSLISSSDERNIILFANDFKKYKGATVRFDSVLVLEKSSGQIIKSWSSFEHKDALLKMVSWPFRLQEHRAEWLRKNENVPVDYEFFHFNSIYEIEENARSREFSYLVPHHFIVNTGIGPVLFFDQDLKLLKNIVISPYPYVNTHDVQITPQGDLLIYWNWKTMDNDHASMLEILRLPDLKPLWSFERNKELPKFFSSMLGSVQLLPEGNFLFSDITEGGRAMEIDPQGRTIKSFYYPELERMSKKPLQFFKIKKRDLSEFMRNHRGEFK